MLVSTQNGYEIQGVSVEKLVEEFGTPLYVYDGEKIKSQYHFLRNAFKGHDIKLKYAAKALTNINILKLLQKEGAGFDAVCINEVKLALQAGFKASDIMFTPNCSAFEEIEEAMEIGVQLNIDNIPFLEVFGEKYGSTVPVCVRINPHIQAGGNKNIQVGHIGSKFGISILQQDEIYEVVKKYNLTINGVHVHTGSDILDTEVFLKGAHVVFEFAKHFSDLEFLDFGSGFKVAYYENAPVTNIPELGELLGAAFEDFCKEYGRKLQIWFEPGKFLVSESGTFLVQVNLIKPTPACVFLGVNSGFNHLVRPMFYGSHHDIVNVTSKDPKKKVYTIVGNICETDTFAEDREMPKAKVGDCLAFKNAGAYGFEMSSNFNSRLKPAEVLIEDGKPRIIRKRQTFEDLLANQIY
jgi:diaminopimelate decarboxylase